MEGVHRFLARAWRAFEGGITEEEPTKDQMRALHGAIKKVRARSHLCAQLWECIRYAHVWTSKGLGFRAKP